MPPEANHDVAADLARLMTPFAERTVLSIFPSCQSAHAPVREPAGWGCRHRASARTPAMNERRGLYSMSELTADTRNGIDFKVADLSLAEFAARRSASPSTRCPA